MGQKLYQYMAQCAHAHTNCCANENTVWQNKWEERLEHINKELLPSGSGFDNGSEFLFRDYPNKKGAMRITSAYHHMNSTGMYVGWSNLTILVFPSFEFGFIIKLNAHGSRLVDSATREYLADTFSELLDTEIVVDDKTGLAYFPMDYKAPDVPPDEIAL